MKRLRPCPEVYSSVVGVFALVLALALLPFPSLATSSAAAAAPAQNQRAPSTETPTPPVVVEYSSGLLSITVKDAEVRAVAEAIAAKSGIEIVLDKDITGKVTAEFKGMKFEEGLKAVLKDVFEGGFSSEYINEGQQVSPMKLTKIVVARLGPAKTDGAGKPAIRISDITVQDVPGEEIVFARWGTGKGEIPLLTETIDGQVFRKGFAKMRVGDDGTIYFVNWANRTLYIYDKDGKPKKPFEIPVFTQSFEVDHEGNLYFFNANQRGPSDVGLVYVYRPDGTPITTVSIPKEQAGFTPYAVIDDGVLRSQLHSEMAYDFRRFLSDPQRHAERRRFVPYLRPSIRRTAGDDPEGNWIFRLEPLRNLEQEILDRNKRDGWKPDFEGEDNVGLPKDTLDIPMPAGWRWGDVNDHVLGMDGRRRLYVYTSTENGLGIRHYSNSAIIVVDAQKKVASYNRLGELDNFVYEKGGLLDNWKLFDIDNAGRVFHIFTTKDGVHIYRYALEGQP